MTGCDWPRTRSSNAGAGLCIIVKLDIDTPDLEGPLVEQLLADPHLLSLVVEFHFEHHVSLPDMRPWWHNNVSSMKVDGSMALFRKLREAGVRAHSWP